MCWFLSSSIFFLRVSKASRAHSRGLKTVNKLDDEKRAVLIYRGPACNLISSNYHQSPSTMSSQSKGFAKTHLPWVFYFNAASAFFYCTFIFLIFLMFALLLFAENIYFCAWPRLKITSSKWCIYNFHIFFQMTYVLVIAIHTENPTGLSASSESFTGLPHSHCGCQRITLFLTFATTSLIWISPKRVDTGGVGVKDNREKSNKWMCTDNGVNYEFSPPQGLNIPQIMFNVICEIPPGNSYGCELGGPPATSVVEGSL